MALRSFALATVADLKEQFPFGGTAQDARIERCINNASAEIEAYLGRRIVFRAPTVDDDRVVASVAIASGALVVAASPASAQTLVVTLTTAATLLGGTLTVTGTVDGVAGTTEVFDLTQGPVLYGVKFFTAVSAAVLASVSGAATTDRIKVGVSGGYVDYYSPRGARCDLWLADWPARQVLTVHEDSSREYGSADLLTVAEDYVLEGDVVGRPLGVLMRVADATSGTTTWEQGYQSIKVVYSAGYFTRTNVPWPIKDVACELAKTLYDIVQHQDLGITSRSEQGGNYVRFATGGLTDAMRERLSAYRAYQFDTCAFRNFDLEAA